MTITPPDVPWPDELKQYHAAGCESEEAAAELATAGITAKMAAQVITHDGHRGTVAELICRGDISLDEALESLGADYPKQVKDGPLAGGVAMD